MIGYVARICAGMLIFMIVLNSVSSEVLLERIDINDRISEEGVLTERLEFTLSNTNATGYPINLPAGATGVMLNDIPVQLNGSLTIPLNCTRCKANVTFTIAGATSQGADGQYAFTRTVAQASPRYMSYSIHIPPGYAIEQDNSTNDPPIVPTPSEIRTDGKNIIVVWEERSPSLPKIYSVNYRKPDPVGVKRSLGILPNALFLLSGLIAGILIGMRLGGRGRSPIPLVPSTLLSPDEKTIVQALKESREKMSQKDLARKLDWSKSKVSGVMSNLEYKRIVRRERVGRNYRVELIKDIHQDE